jgi:hypothetical protein
VSRIQQQSPDIQFGSGNVFDWDLGAPWFQTFCTVFDVGNQQVGFAANTFVVTEP